MKKGIFLTLLILSSQVFAAKATVSNLLYRPAFEIFHYIGAFSFGNGGYDTTLGNTTGEFKTSSIIIHNNLRYGFSKEITLDFQVNYVMENKTKQNNQKSGGTTETPGVHYNGNGYNEAGLDDFYFMGRYRFLKNKDYTIDFMAGLSIGLGARELGVAVIDGPLSREKDGNARRGGHAIKGGASIGGRIGRMEWLANAELEFEIFKSVEQLNVTIDPTLYDESLSINILLEATGQLWVTEGFRAGGTFTIEREGGYERRLESDDNTGNDTDGIFTIAARAFGGVKVSPFADLEFGAEYRKSMDYDYTVVTNGIDGTPMNITGRSEIIFNAVVNKDF